MLFLPNKSDRDLGLGFIPIKKEYDAVLIIGNGFDLSLGLRTGYTDFMNDQTFQKLLSNDNKFAIHLQKTKNLNNWIDIENQLSIYSQTHEDRIPEFYDEFNELSFQLQKYLSSLNVKDLNMDSAASKLINSIIDKTVLIMDFNYTGTLDMLIDHYGQSASNNITHLKIHGSLKFGDIIFGVDDKAKIFDDHIFLRKSVSINYNASNFNKILKDCVHVVIFGHSLGETDHMYFSSFFRDSCVDHHKSTNRELTLFYHSEKSRLALYKQLDILTLNSIGNFKQFNNFRHRLVK